jgi:hypothetical protein
LLRWCAGGMAGQAEQLVRSGDEEARRLFCPPYCYVETACLCTPRLNEFHQLSAAITFGGACQRRPGRAMAHCRHVNVFDAVSALG